MVTSNRVIYVKAIKKRLKEFLTDIETLVSFQENITVGFYGNLEIAKILISTEVWVESTLENINEVVKVLDAHLKKFLQDKYESA